jgi:hypothetical protein
MPLNIDRIDSTIDVAPQAHEPQMEREQVSEWEAVDRARQVRERDERDRARTCAWDHDD